MIQSLSIKELCRYVSAQLNNTFPDEDIVDLTQEIEIVEGALSRLDFCFKHISLQHYFDGKKTFFNHLFSDHYVMFLWYLSNSVFRYNGKCKLGDKLYYLNKVINGIDCLYDTELPDIFLLFHSSGTVLGKATYADYFVALQGCTVGANKGNYPIFGKGVSLTANSSVIGKCIIGNRCTISTRTTIFQKDTPDDTTAYMNFETNQLQLKPSKQCYAQQFFNIDLNAI